MFENEKVEKPEEPKPDWRSWLTHPENVSDEVVVLLDNIAELISEPTVGGKQIENKQHRINGFILQAHNDGLITVDEFVMAKRAVQDNI